MPFVYCLLESHILRNFLSTFAPNPHTHAHTQTPLPPPHTYTQLRQQLVLWWNTFLVAVTTRLEWACTWTGSGWLKATKEDGLVYGIYAGLRTHPQPCSTRSQVSFLLILRNKKLMNITIQNFNVCIICVLQRLYYPHTHHHSTHHTHHPHTPHTTTPHTHHPHTLPLHTPHITHTIPPHTTQLIRWYTVPVI